MPAIIAPWVFEVLASVVLFVTGMLCLVKAQRNYNHNRVSIGRQANLLMAFVAAALALLVLAASSNIRSGFAAVFREPHLRRSVLPWMLAFGALFFAGNMVFFSGIVSAPNPGYARALMTLEVALLTLLSAWLFGSHLSARQGAGIVLVILGAALVSV